MRCLKVTRFVGDEKNHQRSFPPPSPPRKNKMEVEATEEENVMNSTEVWEEG